MINKSVIAKTAAAVFVCIAFLLLTTDSFSRAGRGQSYSSKSSSSKSSSSKSGSYSKKSSSGSSSGSSFSSSGSSKSILPVFIPSSSNKSGGNTGTTPASGTASGQGETAGSDWIYGLIGIAVILLLFALAVYILIKIVKKIFGIGSSKIRFDDTKPAVFEFDQGVLGRIKQSDPDFSPELFMNKAKTIAERLQLAWSSGDMMPVRNYVSQGVFNRFKLQLELMIEEEKVRNILSDYQVLKVSVTGLSLSKSYQTLHVSIFACARDITVAADASGEEKQKALSKTPKEAFYEVYSFTRKLGVRTNTKSDWLKGECPNCGYVPDNFSGTNKCESCGSIYNSGEFDWVLSEITQQEEWEAGSADDIDGLDALEGSNVSINREVIEDRASYLFWRWIYARVKGTPAPLARDASPEVIRSFAGDKETLYDTAVGSVDLISVRSENNDAVADVKILWSTATVKGEEPYHREHNFVLKMPVAQKNPYGLADHSCDSCGGPLPESDALKCIYCGNDLPSTVTDWILVNTEEIEWETEDDTEEDM
jgi:hypothetical protein